MDLLRDDNKTIPHQPPMEKVTCQQSDKLLSQPTAADLFVSESPWLRPLTSLEAGQNPFAAAGGDRGQCWSDDSEDELFDFQVTRKVEERNPHSLVSLNVAYKI